MLRKNVKSLLEQLKVCIFAKIVFGVRCTLTTCSASVKLCFADDFTQVLKRASDTGVQKVIKSCKTY